jgi:hypothetical protein
MKSGLSLKKAAEALRQPNARLVCMFGVEGKAAWFIVPGGRVDDDIAKKLMDRPDVRAEHDGLFPGHSQTWRMINLAA